MPRSERSIKKSRGGSFDDEPCSRGIFRSVSLPGIRVVSEREKKSSRDSACHLAVRKRRKVRGKSAKGMEVNTSAQGHRSGRSKPHSRHDHKCHKAKHKSTESLWERGYPPPHKNRQPGTKSDIPLTALSVDSGLSRTEILSPFEMNVAAAYNHLRTENRQLKRDIEKLARENEEIKLKSSKLKEENENLSDDVSLMKNLVFKLNLELEKYQGSGGGVRRTTGEEKLPKNYEKNFLKPVLPLLKAYSEALREKDDIIRNLESEYKRFSAGFNDLLEENERLHVELEKKLVSGDGGAFDRVKVLEKDLEMAKQENNLLFQQIKLEKEKLVKVHSVFKLKVEELSKEKENTNNDFEECKADLFVLKGKYTVLKQEFERLKMDNDTRVPLAVHSASVNECRKLFQDLKNEYENERYRLTTKIKQLEEVLVKRNKELEDWAEEKNFLEKSNFDQTFEIEALRRQVSELENRLENPARKPEYEKDREELIESKRQLRESNKRVEELNNKLSATKKQLQKAMMFAEDIVRGQEGLLLQLHAKQKENKFMSSQFGSLKSQLKDVEKGAQEDLNNIEEKIKSLEAENYTLAVHNRKLEKLLVEKENIIRKLEPTKDS